jgi:hypothetical protein
VSRGHISLSPPWAAHSQSEWENRAADATLPNWLRVVCYAYGRHEANGHATFTRGQLAWLLGRPPTSKHPFTRATKYDVRDAIAIAVRHGWLAVGSCSECLIVPAHAIEGPIGNSEAPCPVHDRKTKRKLKVAA